MANRILTAHEMGEPILKALGLDLQAEPVIAASLRMEVDELPELTTRHYVRDAEGKLNGLVEALSRYRLVPYDPDLGMLTIEGIKYQAALFHGLATLPVGSRFEIVAREDGALTLRKVES